MLICDTHWSQMVDKATELGMRHLCSHNAQEAAEYFKGLLSGVPGTPIGDDDWDPLLTMNFNYMKRVLLTLGWVDGCPLCIVRSDFDAHNTETGRCGEEHCNIQISLGEVPWDIQWIGDCAEVMREEATRRGVLTLS